MPITVSYPGVYVQSIVQPAPPNAPVPTGLTAFVGRAMMGPVNQPVLLNSWGDFQSTFGGLFEDSSISYQAQAFFNNGGAQAYGVRLFHPDVEDPDVRGALETSVVGWLGAAKTAAANANSNKTAQAAAVASLTTAAQGKMGNDAWVLNRLIGQVNALDLTGLADQAAVAAAVGGLVGDAIPEFTASIAINAINPVYQALSTMVGALSMLGESLPDNKTATMLAAAQGIVSDFSRGPAGAAVAKLKEIMAANGTVSDMVRSLATGMNEAMKAGVPALDSNVTTDAQLNSLGGADLVEAVHAYNTGAAAAATEATSGTLFEALVTLESDPSNPPTPAALKTAITAIINDVKTKVVDPLVTAASASTASDADKAVAGAATAVLTALTMPASPLEGSEDVALAAWDAAAAWIQENWPESASLILSASNPGSWGNSLKVSIDTAGIGPATVAKYGLTQADWFNLTVEYMDPTGLVSTESFAVVTVNPKGGSRYLVNVLEQQARYVRMPAPAGTVVDPGDGAAGTGSGGQDSDPLDIMTYLGNEALKTGIYAMEQVPIFNIMCIPPDDMDGDTDPFIYQTAAEYCVQRNAMLIIDPPTGWADKFKAGNVQGISLNDLGSFGAEEGRSSAVYFPRVVAVDPLANGATRVLPNSGYIAGIWASTDSQTGVWKAPAGLTAAINGIVGLQNVMTDAQNGELNPQGINCLRTFPIGGTVVWGARTLRGADALGDEYNYVPVRRLLLYIMDWVLENTKWAVFEPNDQRLWSSLRLQISSFMAGLWKQGALFGSSADQAFFVRCDGQTTTMVDIDSGIVNVQIGFCPVRPAEFVVVTVQQIAGQAG